VSFKSLFVNLGRFNSDALQVPKTHKRLYKQLKAYGQTKTKIAIL